MARDGSVRGTLAASVTPLTSDGDSVDVDGIATLIDFYATSGLDGLLVLGTTGEGVLLAPDERRMAAERFLQSAGDRLAIVVHCGAQSTRDTVALAEHAAAHAAAGVAVIPPPYYALDPDSILRHLSAAAHACDPVPFYVYEFAARSGYSIPVSVVEHLRATASNLAGLKVSDDAFVLVEPYLIDGLDVFIGSEALIHRGLERGAAGAVSGLAAALPELTISAVRSGDAAASARAGRVRAAIQKLPFQAALKAILGRRGVGITGAVRAPLRSLSEAEWRELERMMSDADGEIAPFIAAGSNSGLS